MKMKKTGNDLLKRIWIISITLLILVAIIPTPNNVVTGKTTINMELKPGWNLEVMPESISASDLVLKSKYITSIVHKSSEGIYETYIPSMDVTDFNCEQNELIYIYSEANVVIDFTISALTEYNGENVTVIGDLDVTGDNIFGRNLTVKGSMTVNGDIEVNSLNVTENLLVDGNLTVNNDLVIGKNLSINGNLMVGNDFSTSEPEGGRADMISAVMYMIIKENLVVEKNLTVDENLIVKENLYVNENLIAGKNLTVYENLIVGNDLTVNEYLIVGNDLTVNEYLYVHKDLHVDENIIVGKDLTVNENLIVGKNLTVGNLTITDDINYQGNLTVMKDLIVNENLMVGKDISANENVIVGRNLNVNEYLMVGKDLTVNENLMVGRDLTVNENVLIGKNVNVNDHLTVGKDLTVNENLIVGKNLIVGNLTITEDLNYGGNLTVGKDLTVDGNLIVGKDLIVGNLTITEDMNYGGNLNVIKNLTVGDDIIVNGNMDIGGELNIGGDLSISGDIIGATGRTVTFVVAANDAPQNIKNQADWVCDGTADDIEIQAALDSCPTGAGIILLSKGTFNTVETLNIPYGVMLEGSGIWQTTINSISTYEAIFYNSAGIIPQIARGGGIKNIYVNGNGITTIGIRIRNAWWFTMENVHVREHGSHGIQIEGSYGVYLEHVDIHQNGGYGINLCDYGTRTNTGIRMFEVEICDNSIYNIAVTSGTRVVMDAVAFENGINYSPTHLFVDDSESYRPNVKLVNSGLGNLGGGKIAVQLDGGDLLLSGNFIHGGGAQDETAIKVNGGQLIVNGNEIYNWGNSLNGGAGIYISNCESALIEGNIFNGYSNSGYAINISGGNGSIIGGNKITHGGIYTTQETTKIFDNYLEDISDIEDYAIYIGGSDSIINNNVINDCQKTGIYGSIGVKRSKIDGNYINNYGISNDNIYYGIYINGYGNQILGNTITTINANKPKYVIWADDVTSTKIQNNWLEGYRTNSLYVEGSIVNSIITGNSFIGGGVSILGNIIDCVIKDNTGYTTENSGTATVSYGTWIDHELASAPSIVTLTPYANVNVWIMDKTDTQFQVGVETGSVTIEWLAKI